MPAKEKKHETGLYTSTPLIDTNGILPIAAYQTVTVHYIVRIFLEI